MDNFKTRLESYMIKRGLNPTSLSKKANLNGTAVRDMLKHRGMPDPRVSTLAKLCQALDVPPHVLSPALSKFYPPEETTK
jgi:DNA-binding Xre family transcriptional regulator